ncbi:MAG: hypothetical protein M3140_06600 [Actinomycetota bacterium]|nr:hypothetical protein [Actinomycetota bacterium]
MEPTARAGTHAALVARGVDGIRPAWLRHTDGESRWGAATCVGLAITLQLVLPERYVVPPRFLLPAVEGVLLLTFVLVHRPRLTDRSPRRRAFSLFLLAVIAGALAVSLIRLVHDVLTGSGVRPVDLLLGGGELWLSIVLVFALIYWQYDRGGPAPRALGEQVQPDLLFPQMTDEHLARDWEPTLLDYFYVAFTCSTAYSPTDTMPLSRWCKLLFTVQSSASLATVTLVAARAVNILPGR